MTSALVSRLLGRAGIILFSNLIRVASGLVVNQVVLSRAGAGEYAFWGLAQSLILFLGLLSDAGASFSHQSIFSLKEGKGQAIISSTARYIIQMRIVFSAVASAVLVALLLLNPLGHGRYLYALICGVCVFAWGLIPTWYFAVSESAKKYYAAEAIAFGAYATTIAILSIFTSSELAILSVTSFAVIFGMLSAYSMVLFARENGVRRILRGRLAPVRPFALRQLSALAVVVGPASLGAIINYVLSIRIDSRDLASLLFCEKFMAAVAYAFGPIVAAAYPHMVKLHREGQISKLNRVAFLSICTLSLAIAAGIATFDLIDIYIYRLLLPRDTAELVSRTSHVMMWAVVALSASSSMRSWLFGAGRIIRPLMLAQWAYIAIAAALAFVYPLSDAKSAAGFRILYESILVAFLAFTWALHCRVKRKWS